MRSRGKSDSYIMSALQKEGYSTAQIAAIMKQLNR